MSYYYNGGASYYNRVLPAAGTLGFGNSFEEERPEPVFNTIVGSITGYNTVNPTIAIGNPYQETIMRNNRITIGSGSSDVVINDTNFNALLERITVLERNMYRLVLSKYFHKDLCNIILKY